MSAYSDWKCGAINDAEFKYLMAGECAEDNNDPKETNEECYEEDE